MKKFWKKTEGFTLVELVVVIAILGVLAGVGTVGYSGYVKKANMAADQQLINGIENALTLSYYGGDMADGTAGFIMLSPNEGESMADSEDGATDIAMEKTFGTNWMDTMQLKYDDWGVSWTTISYEDATNLVNSNFVQKYTPTELMAQVQAMTEAANGLALDIGDTTVQLYDLFAYTTDEGSGDAIQDVIEKYGISKSWNDMTSEEKSNVLVLATANSVSSGTNAGAVGYLTEYSRYAAYAAENATFNEAYRTFQTTIQNVTPDNADAQYDEIKAAYQNLRTAANNSGFSAWDNENKDVTEAAFKAVMKGVGDAMIENGDAILAELNNPNMFTSGIGSELYNDYLDSAYAAAGNEGIADEFLAIQGTEGFEGTVLVQYVVDDGRLYVTNSLPVY